MPISQKAAVGFGTKLDAWKIFLEGRIDQEKGELGAAINAFDRALLIDPINPSFMKAKAAAVTVANHLEAAIVAELAKEYERLALTYVEQDDKPDLWIKELNKLISRIEKGQKQAIATMSAAGVSGTVSIVW